MPWGSRLSMLFFFLDWKTYFSVWSGRSCTLGTLSGLFLRIVSLIVGVGGLDILYFEDVGGV